VASLFNVENLLDPRDDFMGTGIGGLIQVDDTVFQVLFERPLERSGSSGNGGIVSGEDIHLVIIFEEEGPILRLDGWALIGGFDNILILFEFFFCSHFFFDQLFLLLVLGHPLLNSYIMV
jgi:ABC-type cobalamin transport system permease subunit